MFCFGPSARCSTSSPSGPARTVPRRARTVPLGLVRRVARHPGRRRLRHPHPPGPVFRSRPSLPLVISTMTVITIGALLPLSPLAHPLGFVPLERCALCGHRGSRRCLPGGGRCHQDAGIRWLSIATRPPPTRLRRQRSDARPDSFRAYPSDDQVHQRGHEMTVDRLAAEQQPVMDCPQGGIDDDGQLDPARTCPRRRPATRTSSSAWRRSCNKVARYSAPKRSSSAAASATSATERAESR